MKYIIILLALCASLSAKSQEINGVIRDPLQEPTSYAMVAIYTQADSTYTGSGCVADSIGRFRLLIKRVDNTQTFLRVSRIGYTPRDIASPLLDSVIILQSANQHIDEITVRATPQRLIQIKNDGYLINVRNSVLENEVTTQDVLSKIPGLVDRGGAITTIYGETPTIYLDGRKIYSIEEVKNILPSQILNIKLINNPGAEYSSSEKVVIQIKTSRKLDGFSLNLIETVSKNSFWSHSHAINTNYQAGKINISGMFEYADNKQGSHQNRYLKNTGSSIWEHYVDMEARQNGQRSFNYAVAINYDINSRHSIGAMYDGQHNNANALFSLKTTTFKEGAMDEFIEGLSKFGNKSGRNHINIFYIGTLSKKLELTVFSDYLGNNFKRNQQVEEKIESEKNSTLTSLVNSSFYDLFAAKGVLKYTISEKSTLSIGTDFSRVSGAGGINYQQGSANNSSYDTAENKISGFGSYLLTLKPVSISAGLRYEYVRAEQNDFTIKDANIHRFYSNFLPNLNVKFSLGETQHSLSYSTRVTRPSFAWLGTYSAYINKFQREEGNPNLQPELSHHIQYTFSYKNLITTLSYAYVKDYMAMDIVNDPEDDQTTIYTWSNFKKYQRVRLFVNYSKRFGFFEPDYTVSFAKPIFDITYLGQNSPLSKPTFYIGLDNYLHLAKHCVLYLSYSYTSGGINQIYTLGPVHRFDCSLSCRFLKNSLSITVSAQDIFHKDIDNMQSHINNIYIKTREDNDHRNIRVSVSWKFNRSQPSYKGQSSAQNEIDRL